MHNRKAWAVLAAGVLLYLLLGAGVIYGIVTLVKFAWGN